MHFSNYVLSNVSYRNPNTGASQTWPEYDTDTQSYIRFHADPPPFPVENRYVASRMNFWHNLVPVILKECHVVCKKCEVQVSVSKTLHSSLVLVFVLLFLKWI